MNSRITFCSLLFSLFSLTLFAQPTFTITPSTNNPVPIGSTIIFDVTVEDYTNILSTQFAITWNPSVLSFVSIDNPNSVDFPNLNMSNFGTNPFVLSNAYFNISWFDPTISPVTVPNGTRMFSFTMLAVGNGTSPVEFGEQVIQEIIDGDFNDVGLIAADTSVQVSETTPSSIALVPTMSEWGLLIFALLMLNLGLIFIYSKAKPIVRKSSSVY